MRLLVSEEQRGEDITHGFTLAKLNGSRSCVLSQSRTYGLSHGRSTCLRNLLGIVRSEIGNLNRDQEQQNNNSEFSRTSTLKTTCMLLWCRLWGQWADGCSYTPAVCQSRLTAKRLQMMTPGATVTREIGDMIRLLESLQPCCFV
jgi:hypothetical protein